MLKGARKSAIVVARKKKDSMARLILGSICCWELDGKKGASWTLWGDGWVLFEGGL